MTSGRLRVLLVEDDTDTREMLRLVLEFQGLDVVAARDGCEGLTYLRDLCRQHPDEPCAIVLDLMMPRCSGFEFRQRQLEQPELAEVPVVVLSAVADGRERELRPFAALRKPVDPELLAETVVRACAEHPSS
jgi:two-component system chemotaxis response regulator CheY